MTWRELALNIMAMPSDVQDLTARIWLPLDSRHQNVEEFPAILTIGAFDGAMPMSEENFPSLDIDLGPCFW